MEDTASEEPVEHTQTTDQTPARTDDHISDHYPDHNTAPLFKQYINKTKPNRIIITATAFYQEHFGISSPYIAKDIEQWINDTSDLLVMDAMKRALEQNKPSWGYVKGILKSWQTKGIRTVE